MNKIVMRDDTGKVVLALLPSDLQLEKLGGAGAFPKTATPDLETNWSVTLEVSE